MSRWHTRRFVQAELRQESMEKCRIFDLKDAYSNFIISLFDKREMRLVMLECGEWLIPPDL